MIMSYEEVLIEEMLYPLRELKKLRDSGNLNSTKPEYVHQALNLIEDRDGRE